MGQGSYVICEWDSVAKEYPNFQQAFANLEAKMLNKCTTEWAPKTCGYLTPKAGQFGRTTIPPALFSDWWDGTVKAAAASVPLNSAQAGGIFGGCPVGTWRQLITASGSMVLLHGSGTGDVIPEDFKVAWMGLAFPNEQQHVTEIKFQIGDRKYGRINVECMRAYNKPALVFEEGFVLDEEQSFELYGYVEGPIPTHHDGYEGLHQRIVMLGATYYKVVDKMLGICGSAIP